MDLENLLDDVEEQKDEGKLIIDADSICYLSCYAFKDDGNIEDIYIDFWQRVKIIEIEIWKKYQLSDVIISLTSSTNFRYDLYPEYKANRKKKDEQAEKLSENVKKLKKLIYERLR
jgi:5'-3' exonuclease